MKALILTLILFLPTFLISQTIVEKDEHNPVLVKGPSGSWDARAVLGTSVLLDGETYKMWYTGYNGAVHRIGYATSPDGINWTKADSVNPVLDVGEDGSWDDDNVGYPCVILDGTTYKMWYQANNGSENFAIGYATSSDGINWTRHGAPVLEKGSAGRWDDNSVIVPRVVISEGKYIMFYSGYDGAKWKIGTAKSNDGITWEKEFDSNPVLYPTEEWEGEDVITGPVLEIDGVLMMWYSGDNQTGFATSSNGMEWNKEGVVIEVGPSGEWDQYIASAKSALFDGESFHIWYESYSYTSSGSIGYATSPITPAHNSLTHDTGTLQFTVIDNGYIGDDGTGTYGGVVFNGKVNAMFTAGIIGGNYNFGGAYGMVGSFTSEGQPVIQDNFCETTFSGFKSNSFFNQISTAEIGFTPNTVELGQIECTSNTGQNFVFYRRVKINSGSSAMQNMFFGMFADWNVGGANYALNRGGYDPQRNMLYQYENEGAVDPNYYGILPVNVLPNTVMGTVDKDLVFSSLSKLRMDIYDLMTSTDFTPITEDGDYKTYISTGPHRIPIGGSKIFDYAFVVGTDLADLQANADSAILYAQNITDIDVDVSGSIPTEYTLEQNYPNPFNPSTTLKYEIPKESYITLKVYDILGREVATLVNEQQKAGYYEIDWNAANNSSGVYFYRIQARDFVNTKKMILIK